MNKSFNKIPKEYSLVLESLQSMKLIEVERYNIATQMMRKFNATVYSVQPFIRRSVKKNFYENGFLKTEPTDEGNKVLDVLHSSYRVKRIKNLKLSYLRNINPSEVQDPNLGDLFLDISENEEKGLIKVEISLDSVQRDFLITSYLNCLAPEELGFIYRNEYGSPLIVELIDEILIPDLVKEIRAELLEYAENYVIKSCQRSYKKMLMTGPFVRDDMMSRVTQQFEDIGFG